MRDRAVPPRAAENQGDSDGERLGGSPFSLASGQPGRAPV